MRSCRADRLVALLPLLTLWPALALAQPPKAGVVTTLQGQVTVARAALPQPIPLKFKDDVFRQDRITTQEHALARVLLGGKALVTIRELSIFTITEEPGRAVVDLHTGKLALAVAERLLRPGEAVEVRTPHAIGAVRGSLSVFHVTNVTQIWHLQGKPLALLAPADRRPLTSLDPGQKLSASPVGVGPKEAIPPGEAKEVAKTHEDTPKPKDQTDKSPELLAKKVSSEKMQEAAELATRLVPAEVARPGADTVARATTTSPETSTEDLGVQARATTEAAATSATGALPVGTPEVLISGESRTLGATESLKTFSGTSSRNVTAPVVEIANATVTGPGPASVIKVNAGANATLAGPLALVDPSTITTTNPSFNTLATTVGLGAASRGVAIKPDGSRAYMSTASDTIAVIDTATNSVITSVGVGSGARELAVTPNGARVYVSNFTSDTVSVIDTATNAVIGIPIPVGDGPRGIAVTPDGTKVYVANSLGNTFSVIDTATNTVITTTAGGVESGIAGPTGVAITPDGTRAYITNVNNINVSVINTATNTEIALVAVALAGNSTGVAITPDGTRAYITPDDDVKVSVINTATNTEIATVGLGTAAIAVAITPDGTRVYVTNGNSNVSVIGTATNSVIATVGVGGPLLRQVAITPDGSRAYVPNDSSDGKVLDVNPGADFLNIAPGGTIVSTGTGSLIKFDASTATIGGTIAELAGRSTATASEVADGVTLTLGTDKPLQHNGVVVELSGATVTARKGIRVDPALFEASAPLLDLKAASTLTTSLETIDLSLKAKVTSLGPVLRLDASTLNVNAGAAINVAGGSFLKVTGDLLDLRNGSTINVNSLSSGFLIAVSGKSVLNVSGALVNFVGPSSNSIVVKNNQASTDTLSVGGFSFPIRRTGGALVSQVSISGTPIKGSAFGNITFPNGGSLIKVDGTDAKVTISGQ